MKKIIWIIVLGISFISNVAADNIYNGTFIDAHSQAGPLITDEQVSSQINKNDVDLTLLSIRGKHKTVTQRYKNIKRLTQNKIEYLIPTKLFNALYKRFGGDNKKFRLNNLFDYFG